MREFISGSDATDADVEAFDRGELVAWRRGSDGVQWYRRLDSSQHEFPTIKAVPPQAAASASDSDVFDEPAGLDEFERASLQDWADQLRRGAADAVDDDDSEGNTGANVG